MPARWTGLALVIAVLAGLGILAWKGSSNSDEPESTSRPDASDTVPSGNHSTAAETPADIIRESGSEGVKVIAEKYGGDGADRIERELDSLIPDILLNNISHTEEEYIARLLRPLRLNAGADQALDKSDIELVRKKMDNVARVQELTQWLHLDLNGDGAVSTDEMNIRRARDPRVRWRSQYVERLPAMDEDGDGRVTFEEANKAALASRKKFSRQSGNHDQLVQLLELDPNGDNRLTAAELKTLGLDAFRRFDEDGNGVLNAEERKAHSDYRAYLRSDAVQALKAAANCELPKAGPGDQIVLLGVRTAGTIATVTVAGQEQETETSGLHIEKGKSPLYVIAVSSTPMIWRLSGSTQRVSRFITIPVGRPGGEHPQVGVTGLPKARVTFLPAHSCFANFPIWKKEAVARAEVTVESILKRPVDSVVPAKRLSDVSLPSGEDVIGKGKPSGGVFFRRPDGKGIFLARADYEREAPEGRRRFVAATPPSGVDPATYREFLRFSPGAVVQIDPNDVLAPGEVEEYEVLPEEAGLIQLMKEGRIKRGTGPTRGRRRGRADYHVVKPIPRFPAGLAGAHSVRFVFARGVPIPEGRAGHSRVICEDESDPVQDGDVRRCK